MLKIFFFNSPAATPTRQAYVKICTKIQNDRGKTIHTFNIKIKHKKYYMRQIKKNNKKKEKKKIKLIQFNKETFRK